MKEKTKFNIILYFTIFYMIFFGIISILDKNYEFIYYAIIMTILILIILLYHKKLHLSITILTSLTIIGVLHIMGGNIYINNDILYYFWIIPKIFRYDNLVHLIGIFIATFVAYSLLHPHMDKKLTHNKLLLSLLLISIALGIGALIEILELGAVVFLNAGHRVGDYMNNAIDLLFNLLGSIVACFFLMYHHKKRE